MEGGLFYKIAGMVLGIRLPEGYRLIPEDAFQSFRIRTACEDIDIECIPWMCHPEPEGILFYQDGLNQVFHAGQKRLRYIGNFKEHGGMDMCRSCIEYRQEEQRCFRIYLKTWGNQIAERQIFEALGLEHFLSLNGRIILHSSYISYHGKGIVFTAPSGTGKSTQAELWRRYCEDVVVINGDRSILSAGPNGITVHGVPLCGNSGIALNRETPLQAAVILRQGKSNQIRRLGGAEALRLLYSECSVNIWEEKDVEETLAVLSAVIQSVPVYYFSCLPDRTAVELLKKTLQEEQKSECDTEE